MAWIKTIRLLISLLAQMKWRIHQLDVKSTFLNGYLEEVYVEQPLGFVVRNHEDKVLREEVARPLFRLLQFLIH